MSHIDDGAVVRLREIAERTPGLSLLLLHGSRARDSARPDSDWDLAYLSDDSFDPDRLLADLAIALNADRIDLADLSRAGALLRYRAAADGIVIHERKPGTFESFWLQAVDTWCDLAPVLLPAYDAILAEARRQ